MSRIRLLRWSAAAAMCAALALAAVALGAAAPAPRPLVRFTARVSPSHGPIPTGVPLALSLRTAFSSTPPGADLVLQSNTFLFGRGPRFNGARFPSCSVAKLRAARGRLSVCPPGSKVGTGVATARAVAFGITSSGTLTIFNGPRGRSVTVNVAVVHPALVNATFPAPIRRLRRGRYGFELTAVVPPELQTILDSDIVVTRLDITTGAVRVIGGRRTGYYEAGSCPKRGGAIHGEFRYRGGAIATADVSAVC